MKNLLEPRDSEFLQKLQRLGNPTVQELCDEIDVTPTAVRQRLSRLQALGFVARETIRTGRGRPHHSYRVTDAGRRQLGDNYGELALILWREVKQIDDPAVRQRVVNRVRDALVARYGRAVVGETAADRVRTLGLALREQGLDVEVDASDSLPILRENHCPYWELAENDPAICELERSVFQRVLGGRVSLEHCCLDGHGCCEFSVADSGPAGED